MNQQKLTNNYNPKKRKYIENKLSNCDQLLPILNDKKSKISFTIQSSTDSNKFYDVIILNTANGIEYQCNCGEQWNINPPRNNCKHIGAVLSNLLKTYVLNHHIIMKNNTKQLKINDNDTATHKDDLSIDDIIEQFKKFL